MSSIAPSVLGFTPDWPLPAHVRSFITFRTGGCSKGVYTSNNLADHVGDDPEAVSANRRVLSEALALPQSPLWLNQVHGNQLVDAQSPQKATADGSYTDVAGVVCAVLTADCLPILLCDREGNQVAAVHGGWRGLAGGIITEALAKFDKQGPPIMAFLGPAISATVYEVGEEVVTAFANLYANNKSFMQPNSQRPGHYFLDLYAVARLQLQKLGVKAIYGGDRCSFRERDYFYSFRRDGQTGRMATLIWKEERNN